MTRALVIETTSRRGAAALVEHGRVADEAAFTAGLNHTAGLLPLVTDLCRRHGWPPREIAHVYVSVGPGGFTGTRVGVTLAKTFAFATGAKVVAVPTPRVLVENLPPEATAAAVVVDARRGLIWAERFEKDAAGAWRSLAPGTLTTPAALVQALPRPVWLVGEGVAYHRHHLAPADPAVRLADDDLPRVAVVARLGATLAERGVFADAYALTPVYVRRPEAEEKRLAEAADST